MRKPLEQLTVAMVIIHHHMFASVCGY